jgi:microcystin-dependent protein
MFSDEDKFTSGDFEPVGRISYRLTFFNTLWMLEAVMQAISTMVSADNWNDVGTLTPDECAEFGIEMVEDFEPMVSTCGVVMPFAGDALPVNALWADGGSYLRADYPNLFTVIGTVFGSVDDDHFNVPDMSGRVPVSANGPAYGLGDVVGEETHTLTIAEMPNHAHLVGALDPSLATEPGEVPVWSPDIITPYIPSGYEGGGMAHNNVQPSLALNYIIYTV